MRASIAKKILRSYALQNGYRRQQVREYINEAEHQDGVEYWKNFKGQEELFDDFALYWATHVN